MALIAMYMYLLIFSYFLPGVIGTTVGDGVDIVEVGKTGEIKKMERK